jgi:PadR family transcriptional regulator, regulatory protein PadR
MSGLFSQEKWDRQMRKGFLELCVLSAIESVGKIYGFLLLESLQSKGLGVSEGTLYPLLNRLQMDGWLQSEWQTPLNGTGEQKHPRKFYFLTEAGGGELQHMQRSFEQNFESYIALKQVSTVAKSNKEGEQPNAN